MKTNRRQQLKQKANQGTQPTVKKRTDGYAAKIAPKTISRARQDIASMNSALRQADNADMPKRVLLHKLFKDITNDSVLSSHITNRRMISTSAPFTIMNGDKADDDSTALLKSLPWFNELLGIIFDTQLSGTALIEFITDDSGILKPVLIPKQNVIPGKGILLLDETETTGIDFRNIKEYGSWLIEIGRPEDFGLLVKAIPHVLFKRFAISCYSELCEIYGIPPRVLKTNTQDDSMLSRAEQMMRDMGSASWFIIDETEEFEFATGVAAITGDMYTGLIRICDENNSLLISGAVIGQDTKNGNRSKEQVSVDQLMRLAESDKRLEEGYMNSVVMPALYLIGLLPDGLTFKFDPQEDTQDLYTRTLGFMQYLDPDVEWLNEKFGTNFTGLKALPAGGTGANFQQPGKKG